MQNHLVSARPLKRPGPTATVTSAIFFSCPSFLRYSSETVTARRIRGPCRCCDRNQPNRLFRRNSKLFRRLFVQNTDRAPRVRSFREFPLSINALPEKNFVFQKKETSRSMFLPPALPSRSFAPYQTTIAHQTKSCIMETCPPSQNRLIGFKQLPTSEMPLQRRRARSTTHIADPDTPHSFPLLT